MGLEKYNEKRDFSKTKEPKGIQKNSKGKLRFVVQKHAASHLHYDFRLEIDGVLVSWAIPKGPSANPSDRRLAVQTEDHPMDYIDFEGTIPEGEYGGGTVMVWDNGTYHAENNDNPSKDNALMKTQLASGSIKIILEGSKLKGSWHLVMMKGENRQWLLMKGKDGFAGDKIEYNPYSIVSGRDFDEIAKGNDVWDSTKRPEKYTPAVKEKTEVQKIKKNTKTDGIFSAADLAGAVKIEKFPLDWRPQMATLADGPFDNKNWLFETKFDGYRALAQIKDKKATLVSRNGIAFNKKYPEIAKALDGIAVDVILDGEIIVEDEKEQSHFQWLQNRNEKPKQGQLKYYVFDILYFQGYDLRKLELVQRKKILKAILPKLDSVIYSEHITGDGIKTFELIQKKGGEGVIAKKATSQYHINNRSKDWLKVKTGRQQEMVIGGFTDPQKSRKGIGALLCGYYKDKEFHYSGKVGTGFTDTILEDLRKRLDKLERKTPAFIIPPKERGVHWVSPKLIAQIKFSEFTDIGSMRHPVYLGLREDKNPLDITMELPQVVAEEIPGSKTENDSPEKIIADKKEQPVKTVKEDIKPKAGRVEFTNLDKIFWPKEKITKGDVINYYDSISDYILPYLKDRPQSLRRTPDGIKNQGFFQKDVAGMVPKWIKTKKIKSESDGEPVEYLLCQDKETLLFLTNYGCIELNPWSSRIGSLNNPDYIIFDLDPKGAPMKNIVTTALKVKEILDSLHVPAYIKTSGGNGIHIFIPIEPKYTYEQTRHFSELVSQMVHRDLPDITSLERMPAKRKGKVYLDFLQNGKGKTMASIYSLRPREGAGVSTPLEWNEINDDFDVRNYNIKTIPERLKEKGDLWKGFFDNAINLKTILQRI